MKLERFVKFLEVATNKHKSIVVNPTIQNGTVRDPISIFDEKTKKRKLLINIDDKTDLELLTEIDELLEPVKKFNILADNDDDLPDVDLDIAEDLTLEVKEIKTKVDKKESKK